MMDLDWNTIGIFAGLIIAVVAIVKYFTKLDMRVEQVEKKLENLNPTKTQESKESPEDILERRLANGDINEEQFENLKKKLKRDK